MEPLEAVNLKTLSYRTTLIVALAKSVGNSMHYPFTLPVPRSPLATLKVTLLFVRVANPAV